MPGATRVAILMSTAFHVVRPDALRWMDGSVLEWVLRQGRQHHSTLTGLCVALVKLLAHHTARTFLVGADWLLLIRRKPSMIRECRWAVL